MAENGLTPKAAERGTQGKHLLQRTTQLTLLERDTKRDRFASVVVQEDIVEADAGVLQEWFRSHHEAKSPASLEKRQAKNVDGGITTRKQTRNER